MPLVRKYLSLLETYGQQGWWPVVDHTGQARYHPGDYSYPKTQEQQWEICMGAVLTQSTNWGNVEKALTRLLDTGINSPEKLLGMHHRTLAALIRSSGYYNQKAKKLRALAQLLVPGVRHTLKTISRDELLQVKGIGPETADSILLYAGKRPFFVVDAYTRRLFGSRFQNKGYEDIREAFERALPRNRKIYNEYHALIVRAGKR